MTLLIGWPVLSVPRASITSDKICEWMFGATFFHTFGPFSVLKMDYPRCVHWVFMHQHHIYQLRSQTHPQLLQLGHPEDLHSSSVQ